MGWIDGEDLSSLISASISFPRRMLFEAPLPSLIMLIDALALDDCVLCFKLLVRIQIQTLVNVMQHIVR